MKPLFRNKPTLLWAVAWNMLLMFLIFTLCRLVFLAVNFDSYEANFSTSLFWSMMRGGLLFDTSALCYMNALYIVLMLLPCHAKENPLYYKIVRWIFVVVNALGIIANLIDTVYFRFSGRRTTASIFQEFGNEDNLVQIFANAFVQYWYLTLLGVVLIVLLYFLYWNPKAENPKVLWKYYVTYSLCLMALAPFIVFGMRGGIGSYVRPISLSNASKYVNRPSEAAVALNTPFSIFRTIGKKNFSNPHYLSDEEMTALFTPIRQPADSLTFRQKNVVVFILESFGKEYFGTYNKDLENGTYKGYTPFLDSLATQSFTFEYSFGNGRKSIDGMPSVLSSIPMFIEPFILTPSSLNKVRGIAAELNDKGYYTAFFHGAPNGSMGFQAYARTSGFNDYYGRDEYYEDSRFNGAADYDGYWAIWDEEFFQFFCLQMDSFQQPFMTAMFSATSHHPFSIPERYKSSFIEHDQAIHKCLRYSDYSLRRFFEEASKKPWFKNTLFVLTADHTNQTTHPEYMTDAGRFSVPVIFYDPSGDLKAARPTDVIAQQIDIMPTVLGYLGYDKPYLSFGVDLLNTPPEQTYAVNYSNGIYQYFKGDYLLQFDGQATIAVYAFKTDRLLKENLLGKVQEQEPMEKELKAIIQQYMQRMEEDRLTVQ